MTSLNHIPIDVLVDAEGSPICLTWDGRQHSLHIHQAWTVDDKWWDERIFRSYFKVTTDTGLLLVIFQNKVSGDWFLQRVYD